MNMENTQTTTDNSNNNVDGNPAQPTLQDIEKKFFPSSALDAGQEYIGSVMEICNRENISPVLNFDAEEEFPEGYGLAILPLSQRVAERGNVISGVAIAAVPEYETILADETGLAFIQKQIQDNVLRQVVAASKSKDGALTSIPYKIADFTTSTRASGLAAFNHVATMFVKALKGKGLKLLSKGFLRQILASAAFAEQQYPRIPQDNWVHVLNSMVAHAQACDQTHVRSRLIHYRAQLIHCFLHGLSFRKSSLQHPGGPIKHAISFQLRIPYYQGERQKSRSWNSEGSAYLYQNTLGSR